MRKLAQELGVVPMALYKHVANKDELLDGMVDVVVGEIDPPAAERRLAARGPRADPLGAAGAAAPPVGVAGDRVADRADAGRTAYMDSMIGMFRAGGFSVDLTHHVMHAMGSRMLGFSQELFDTPPAATDPPIAGGRAGQMAARFPHIAEIALTVAHDDASVVGSGCDDQFEFEFALDLLLDGLERLRARGWTSRPD